MDQELVPDKTGYFLTYWRARAKDKNLPALVMPALAGISRRQSGQMKQRDARFRGHDGYGATAKMLWKYAGPAAAKIRDVLN